VEINELHVRPTEHLKMLILLVLTVFTELPNAVTILNQFRKLVRTKMLCANIICTNQEELTAALLMELATIMEIPAVQKRLVIIKVLSAPFIKP
jgi:hypothetical protein